MGKEIALRLVEVRKIKRMLKERGYSEKTIKAILEWYRDLVKGDWKNPRKRRDRPSMMAEILEIAKGSALKTHIMYKANLNFTELNECLSLLLETGLLEAVNKGEKVVYKTTRKGLHYVQDHKKIMTLLMEKE